MKEMREPRMEGSEKITVSPPPLEALTNPKGSEASWLKDISENGEFREQVEERKKLNDRLDAVIAKLPRPDISLEEAIALGHLTETEVTNLYESLTGLIEDPDYCRAVLYLPFEFLPSDSWKPQENHLQSSLAHFKDAYRLAWNGLLTTMDVRANFVDGDVLEDEYREGDHPRVIKVAHLIPKLVEKGMMSRDEVLRMLRETHEPTLLHSIADTLPVLADLKLISDVDLHDIASTDAYVQEKIKIAMSHEHVERDHASSEHVTVDSIQDQLRRHMMYIDTAEYGEITKNREEWIRTVQQKRAVEFAGNDIQSVIERGELEAEEVEKFISPDTSIQAKQALIVGVRHAIESLTSQDRAQAESAYLKYRKALITMWREEVPELQDELRETFCHLHGLGIVSDEQLHTLGMKIPALAGPFSKNLESMQEESKEIKQIVSAIERDSELSTYLYPTAIFYGSRLKGYGKKNADTDIAIFFKPETPFEKRDRILARLGRSFEHHFVVPDEIKEFWLKGKGDDFEIDREREQVAPTIGGPSWTHMIFGGAWEGDQRVTSDLQKKLLVPYFFQTDERIYDLPFRRVCLEELERDSLQYRLMHKGYERFNPPFGGIKTPHADSIDAKSAFYDSGYRQTATKLFASRVFLPKLTKG